jgi:hypothetical protein
VSRQAIADRIRRGLLPTYGPGRRIDVTEADRLWVGLAARPEAVVGGFDGAATAIAQARTALLLTETQLRHLRLADRRSQLIARDAVLAKFALTVRTMRDTFRSWPARIAAELAADLTCASDQCRVEPAEVERLLQPYVQRQLDELADVRLDLGPGRPEVTPRPAQRLRRGGPQAHRRHGRADSGARPEEADRRG